MTVLADDRYLQYAVGGRRVVARPDAERRVAGARRTPEEALRRPPGGTRVSARPRPAVSACAAPGVSRAQRRWRLLLATAAAVCIAVVALGAVIGGLASGMSAEVPQRTALVSVAPGETLWDVAAKYAPESDPRAVVDRIEELNGVTAAEVSAGFALTVPVSSQG